MAYRMARAEDREAVEDLWSYSFESKDDPFFQYYFEHCYRPEDTLLVVEDVPEGAADAQTGQVTVSQREAVLANLHLRPYTVAMGPGVGHPVRTSYIVGVSTAPEFRNRKVGRGMLREALRIVAERGEPVSILMPSRAGFYQPLGWELYCHQWEREMPLRELKALGTSDLAFQRITSVDSWGLLAPVYEAFTAPLHGYAVRTEASWRTLLGSWLAEGVHVVVAYEAQTPVAYMVYRLGEPTIVVPEMVYTSRRGQQALFGYLGQHQSQGTSARWNEWLGDAGYRFYPDGKGQNRTMPFMMGRITDPLVALAGWQVPAGTAEGSLTLALTDPLVPEWTGTYALKNVAGRLAISRIADTVTETAAIHIDVGALSLLYWQVLSVEALSFEGRVTGTAEALATMASWFPPVAKPAFINEWY